MKREFFGHGVTKHFGKVLLQKTRKDYLCVKYYGEYLTFETKWRGKENLTVLRTDEFIKKILPMVEDEDLGSRESVTFMFTVPGDMFDYPVGTLRKIYKELAEVTTVEKFADGENGIIYHPLTDIIDLLNPSGKKMCSMNADSFIKIAYQMSAAYTSDMSMYITEDELSVTEEHDDGKYVNRFRYDAGKYLIKFKKYMKMENGELKPLPYTKEDLDTGTLDTLAGFLMYHRKSKELSLQGNDDDYALIRLALDEYESMRKKNLVDSVIK